MSYTPTQLSRLKGGIKGPHIGLRSQRGRGHGQTIYAYCNIRTNQVLYSLSQSMNSYQSLKQLPDLGPNTVPPRLRKDVWRPLYTVSLPPSPAGQAQGLDAFRRLREYRYLHETCWKPTEELKRNYTEAEMEKIQTRLDERGGSKKESVYDMIKREKRKLRQRIVMNQKSNSVADLADVLAKQEQEGYETWSKQVLERWDERQREVREMLSLARQAEEGGVEKVEKEMQRLQAILERSTEDHAAIRDRAEVEGNARPMSKNAAKAQLFQTRVRKLRMEFAAKAVGEARERVAHERVAPGEEIESAPEQTTNAVGVGVEVAPRKERIREEEEEREEEERLQLERQAKEIQQQKADELRPQFLKELVRESEGFIRHAEHDFRQSITSGGLEARMRKLGKESEGEEDRRARRQVDSALQSIRTRRRKLEALDEGLRDARAVVEEVRGRGTGESEASATQRIEGLDTEIRELSEAAKNNPDTSGKEDGKRLQLLECRRKAFFHVFRASRLIEGEEATTTPIPQHYLPPFPHRTLNPYTLPKHSPLRHKLLRLHAPVFTMEGVKVEWSDMLDAEFAQAWPQEVEHGHMGLVRHTAKKPGVEPVLDVGGVNAHLEVRARERKADAAREAEAEAADVGEGEVMGTTRRGRMAEAKRRKEVVDEVKRRIVDELQARSKPVPVPAGKFTEQKRLDMGSEQGGDQEMVNPV
ncbi:hypothetical protein LTR37_003066 [Vermiconidia calcicola]|uniref:Uncharacterized protein n=1 Tax=Vermiconidia calcicola TaxID=1690605 RepID=A0ACC3NQT1_9PEZI|nr:hypothetical protein LTR37_003066 [Vermiconidia calcicola]